MKKHLDYTLVWVLGGALIIKMVYLFAAYPLADSVGALSIDALYHYNWAQAIASGELFANAPYFRAPLYPFFLALLLKVSGMSLVFARLVLLLSGCFGLFLVFRLTERISGRVAGYIACLLLIFYPITTYFEGELLLDWPFTLLSLATLYFLFLADDNPKKPLWTGVFFALAALTRPTILIFLPAVLIYFWTFYRPGTGSTHSPKAALIFSGIVLLLILPVTTINFVTSGQMTLISYQGGINFYIGNNPEADGVASVLPQIGQDWALDDADYLASLEAGQPLRYSKQSLFWYRKGLQFVVDQPKDFLRLFGRKLKFVFSAYEISNNRPLEDAVFENAFLSALPVRFALLLALAALPLFLQRDRRRDIFVLYGIIIVYALTLALFFISSRFRLPLVPILAILAGSGVVALGREIKARRIGYRLFLSVVASGAVLVGAYTDLPLSLHDPRQALFLRANLALRQGAYTAAIAGYDSLAVTPSYYKNCFVNMGIAYLKRGEADRAMTAFRREMSQNPASAEAANNISALFLLRQQPDSAVRYAEQALRSKPYYRDAAINYLRAAQRLPEEPQREQVESLRRQFRRHLSTEPKYVFEEGLYFVALGRASEAIDNFLRVIDAIESGQTVISFDEPFSAGRDERRRLAALSNYQLGYLYGLGGDYQASVGFSRRAIELDGQLKQAYINLISGYRALGEIHRADSLAAVYISRWPTE